MTAAGSEVRWCALTADEYDRVRCLAGQCESDGELLLACMAELEALRRLHSTALGLRGRPLRLERAVHRLPRDVGDTAAWRAAVTAGRDVYERSQLGTPDLLRRAGAM